MAAAVLSSPTMLPQSGHFLAHHAPASPNSRVHFAPSPAHVHHPRQAHTFNNNAHVFNAFDMHHHHHSHNHGPSPASTSTSWRVHAHAPEPAEPRSLSPKRAGGRTHSRAPSSASESSSTGWRSRSSSRDTRPDVRPTPSVVGPSSPSAHPRAIPIYTPAELLRLSSSPNVGISDASHAALEDFVAHWVWRRGPHTGPASPQRQRGHKRVSSSASLSSHGSHSSDSDGSGSV